MNVPVTDIQSYSALSSANSNVLGANAQVKRANGLLDQAQAQVAKVKASGIVIAMPAKYTPTVGAVF